MNTKALRQKILDLAIHGKLVPQDPNDEPASVLLERIKAEKERLIKEGKIKRSKRSKAACDKPHYENEAPFEVPSSWKWCKLGEVCIFLSRGKSPKYLDEDRQYPVFAQKCNLKEGGISLAQARFLDPMTINKWDEVYKLRTGDVLVNSTGTGTVGRTRLFNESCLGDYPFVVPDSHVSVVRTANEIVSEYIYAYMSSNVVQEYLEDNLAGSTNQKELYIGILDSLQIPLPPYVEQKRIVSEIEKWYKASEAIENGKSDLEKVIRQTKNKILELAIHGKLVPQNPTDEPAYELLKRINPKAEITCDNPHYRNLPEGWAVIKVGNVAKYTNGRAFKPEEWESTGLPIIRIQNLNDADAPYNRSSVIHEQKYLIKDGDLLFAWAASIGTYIWSGENAWLNQHIFKVEPYPFIDKAFLFYAFQAMISEFYKNSHGSGMVHITKKQFEEITLLLPPLSEQIRIVECLEQTFSILDSINCNL